MHQPKYSLDRRGFLRVGTAGVVGAAVPWSNGIGGDTGLASETGKGKAKSVLIVLLSGGPSQLDTLDPKPDAPAEIRGEFKTIGTTIPGVVICEHLPPAGSAIGSMGDCSYSRPSRAKPSSRNSCCFNRSAMSIAKGRKRFGSR